PKPTDEYLAWRPVELHGGTTTEPPVQMSWEPVLNHNGTHVHVLGNIPTPTGDAEFTTDEFHGADSHYILRFIVTKNGCTTTVSQNMFPQTGRYYMNATTTGDEPVPDLPLTFLHTSTPETVASGAPGSPAYFQVAKNARATVRAPESAIDGGYTYTFSKWSDGGAREHEVHPYEYKESLPHLPEDPQGLTATFTRSNNPPTATIESPADGDSVPAGQLATVTGAATDPEDGAEPGGQLTWTITRHANATDTLLPVQTGTSATFTPETGGDANATYTVVLLATDSHGLSSQAAITLKVVSAPTSGGGSGGGGSGGGGGTLGGGVPNPIESMTKPPSPVVTLTRTRAHRPTSLAGTASDPAGMSNVSIAIRPQHVTGKGCIWWSTKHHRLVRVNQKCSKPQWVAARLSPQGDLTRWTAKLGGHLPPGRFLVVVRAVDRGGRGSNRFQGNPSGLLTVR
ncbi:MAG: hypothetical protein ACRDJ3_03925, partial [Solirubrobacteraceae bacterium]